MFKCPTLQQKWTFFFLMQKMLLAPIVRFYIHVNCTSYQTVDVHQPLHSSSSVVWQKELGPGTCHRMMAAGFPDSNTCMRKKHNQWLLGHTRALLVLVSAFAALISHYILYSCPKQSWALSQNFKMVHPVFVSMLPARDDPLSTNWLVLVP